MTNDETLREWIRNCEKERAGWAKVIEESSSSTAREKAAIEIDRLDTLVDEHKRKLGRPIVHDGKIY